MPHASRLGQANKHPATGIYRLYSALCICTHGQVLFILLCKLYVFLTPLLGMQCIFKIITQGTNNDDDGNTQSSVHPHPFHDIPFRLQSFSHRIASHPILSHPIQLKYDPSMWTKYEKIMRKNKFVALFKWLRRNEGRLLTTTTNRSFVPPTSN